MKTKAVTVVFLCSFNIGIYSQNPEWINYTNGDQINAIAQEGSTVWVATSGGLVSIDKNTDNTVYYNRSNSGLPSNNVSLIVVDKAGNKWMKAGSDGLVKFDGTTWVVYDTSNSGLPSNVVSVLALDTADNLWIGTDPYWNGSFMEGGGLTRYDGVNWTTYDTSNSGCGNNYIRFIAVDDSNHVWLGYGDLVKFDGTNWTIYDGSNLPGYNITALAVEGNTIWLGTEGPFGTGAGLTSFDGTTWTTYTTGNSGLPFDYISSIVIDGNGNKCMGVMNAAWGIDGAFVILEDTNWTTYTTSNSGLVNPIVNCLFVDDGGDKWIGTNAGMVKFDDVNWTGYVTSNSGLPSNGIRRLAINATGDKWITTYNGLAKFDDSNWTVYDTSNSEIPGDPLDIITIDKAGNLWMGSYLVGLIKFDGSNWTLFDTSNSFIPSHNIWAITESNNGIIWIGTSNSGLAKLDGTNWTTYTTSNSGLPTNKIRDLQIDANDNLWIATGDSGLIEYDGSNWTTHSQVNFTSLLSLAIDGNGMLWVGSAGSGGIAQFDGTTWTTYSPMNSQFPDMRVNDIAIDANDSVWAGTRKGLAKFDGTDWIVYNTSNSGLAYNYVTSVAIDSVGNKWIGTTQAGLNVFKQGGVILGINEESIKIPSDRSLIIYPNPFSTSTTIEFQNKDNENHTLAIYNSTGQLVRKIENITEGQIKIERENLLAGLYFFRLMNNATWVGAGKIIVE